MKLNSDLAIILFSKVPRPGFVKTRTISENFTQEQASSLQKHMLLDTLDLLSSIQLKFHLILSYHPEGRLSKLKQLFSPFSNNAVFLSVTYFPQTEDSIGERFNQAFKKTFSLKEINHALIIGADTPHLKSSILENACNILYENKRNTVIGSSQNNGFYLFGLSKYIDLSNVFTKSNEFSTLVDLSYKNDLNPVLLPFVYDIDLMHDMYTLYSELKPKVIENIVFNETNKFPKRTFAFLKEYYKDDF